MLFRRGRCARFIAAVVTIALSTQVAGAQVASCMKMNASQEHSGHAAMVQHTGGSSVTTDSRETDALGPLACGQSLLCVNAPAVLDVTVRATPVHHIASPIVYDPSTLEARSLRPDSPPPKT